MHVEEIVLSDGGSYRPAAYISRKRYQILLRFKKGDRRNVRIDNYYPHLRSRDQVKLCIASSSPQSHSQCRG